MFTPAISPIRMRLDTPHGRPGHLNTNRLDQHSASTGHGAHYRVVAFLPNANGLYCRVDHKHGQRMPTDAEILRAARATQGVTGRWTLASRMPWPDGSATDIHFTRV